MLQLKNNLFDDISETPREHYTFWFDYAAVASVEKKYIGFLIKRMLISIGLLFILSVYAAFCDRKGLAVAVLRSRFAELSPA